MSGGPLLLTAVVGAGFVWLHHVDAVPRGAYAEWSRWSGPTLSARPNGPGDLGVPRSTARFADVVEDPDVDVVHVCTPNVTHVKLASAAPRCRQSRSRGEASRHQQRRRSAAGRPSGPERPVLGRAFTYRRHPATRLDRSGGSGPSPCGSLTRLRGVLPSLQTFSFGALEGPKSLVAAPPFALQLERTALVVVDMQNDFVREGAPLEVPDARATIPVLRRLLDWFRGHERPVIFTKFLAGPQRMPIWNWSPVLAPPVCCCWKGFTRSYDDIKGSHDCTEIVHELAPLPAELIIEKYGYSAFFRTNLVDQLRARGVETVVVTGTVTQVCVDETARGASEEGLQAVIVQDAVSSYAPDLHAATLKNFALKFGRVVGTDQLLAELNRE